ncbi:TIGR01212 family radical SAM protein [Marinilabiliaceae bacterium ANBcel2]|nr:TIGR01212 family radical SAM protein [Marinilabiliaceae bacterium ANBcel2]
MSYYWGHNRRFNDFSNHIRKVFNGSKMQKISIHAGFTCPNRDGTKGVGGCTFCNNESFKPSYCQSDLNIAEQINRGIKFFERRYDSVKYIAYFQAYTNSYAPLETLIDLYESALSYDGVEGLIIGTRPDCLSDQLIDYLKDIQKRYYVAVELGVESTLDVTLERINRGHSFDESKQAINILAKNNIPVGVHMIMGLPGESFDDMLKHGEYISKLPVNYLKLHQLQYVKGSKLGNYYLENPQPDSLLNLDQYIDFVVTFLENLRPDIVMERFTSQAPHSLLIAPKWGIKNFEFVRILENRMEKKDTWQGKYYSPVSF